MPDLAIKRILILWFWVGIYGQNFALAVCDFPCDFSKCRKLGKSLRFWSNSLQFLAKNKTFLRFFWRFYASCAFCANFASVLRFLNWSILQHWFLLSKIVVNLSVFVNTYWLSRTNFYFMVFLIWVFNKTFKIYILLILLT